MEQLSDELGGFPLAIGQLGTYINEHSIIIREFDKADLKEQSAKTLDRVPSDFHYRSSLHIALKMTQENFKKLIPKPIYGNFAVS